MDYKLLFVLCFVALMGATEVMAAGWDYSDGAHGPAKWGDDFPICYHKKQSPIDIELCKSLEDKQLGKFNFTNFDQVPLNASFVMLNNGHTLGVDVSSLEAFVSGGGLSGTFHPQQFHFHWGIDGTHGSEHEIEGKRYAGEIHIVNYNSKYANLSMAVAEPDGLAVLGTVLTVGKKNDDFDRFLKYVKNVTKSGTSVNIHAFSLDKLLPSNRSAFYRYNGSLTTPPCYESVTWTLFKDVLQMSEDQFDQLRSLQKSDNTTIQKNFRPVRPWDGRVVKTSFQIPDSCHSTPSSAKSQAFSGVLAVFFGALALVAIAH